MSDAWLVLRRLTPARIALGHAGSATPTGPHLDFQLAHARARDAVARELDVEAVSAAVRALGAQVVHARTQAQDRAAFLANPHSGALLDDASRAWLAGMQAEYDVVFVLADGLSAAAVERHGPEVLKRALADERDVRVAPVIVVTQGRVAIGDDIGARIGARLAVVLIGERPGLSSPDSLGIYVTYGPRPGRTNAERNCISNVRPEGLPYDVAVRKLDWLMTEATRRGMTGVALKEEA